MLHPSGGDWAQRLAAAGFVPPSARRLEACWCWGSTRRPRRRALRCARRRRRRSSAASWPRREVVDPRRQREVLAPLIAQALGRVRRVPARPRRDRRRARARVRTRACGSGSSPRRRSATRWGSRCTGSARSTASPDRPGPCHGGDGRAPARGLLGALRRRRPHRGSRRERSGRAGRRRSGAGGAGHRGRRRAVRRASSASRSTRPARAIPDPVAADPAGRFRCSVRRPGRSSRSTCAAPTRPRGRRHERPRSRRSRRAGSHALVAHSGRLALEQELFGDEAWTAELFWSELANPTAYYLVAHRPRAQRELLGYGGSGGGRCRTPTSRPSGCTARPSAAGIGRRMMHALLDEAARRRATSAGSRCAPTTSRSAALPLPRLRRPRDAPRLLPAVGGRRTRDAWPRLRCRAGSAMTTVLGFETSCDETGIGIVRDGVLLADALATSIEEHARFGGVVPEVAARAHVEAMVPTVHRGAGHRRASRAAEIDAVAVTEGPGLAGPLMVGVAAAKAYALGLGRAALRRAPSGGPRRRRHPANPGRCRRNASRCWSRAGTRRCWPSVIWRIRRSRSSARRSTTRRGRPTTRWPGCSAWAFPGGPEIDRAAADGERQHRLPPGQGGRRHASTSPSAD